MAVIGIILESRIKGIIIAAAVIRTAVMMIKNIANGFITIE
jgi:hypothetical protein